MRAPGCSSTPRFVVCLIVAVAGCVACHGVSVASAFTEPLSDITIGELIIQLASSQASTRSEAREALQVLGGDAVPELIRATESPDALLRWEATNLLGGIGDLRATDAVLRLAMTDPDVHARWRSNWAITQLDDGTVVPRLIEALTGDDPTIVWNSAVTLSMFGELAAVPILHQGLRAVGWLQWEAANALGRVWNDNTVSLLIPVLEGGSEDVRKEAALSLGRIGGADALDALLVALLQDPASEVRWRAAMMIGYMGDVSAIPSLEQARDEETVDFVLKYINEAIARLTDNVANSHQP